MRHTDSQREQILAALQRGERLTSDDARALCGCARLASRIDELRKAGVPVRTTPVRTAGGARIAEYSLEAPR